MAKNKFTELLEGRMELVEAVEGAPRSIRVNGAMTAEVVNGNRRVYPSSVLEAAVAELRDHLNESAGQGRAVRILGEAEHPSDKGGRANLLETVTKWNEVTFDGSKVDIVGNVLPTTKGRDILTLLENGVMPGVSMRGYGEGQTEGKGEEKIFRVSDLHITGFDLVLEPSFENQVYLLESQNQDDDAEASGENEMSDELLEKLQLQEQEKAELKKQLEVAQKLAAEGEQAKAELEAGKRKSEVEIAITEATKDLPFGKELNEMFVESIKDAHLADATAVKQFAESKRTEYGKLAAKVVLKGMGFDGKITGVQSVLEAETGTPDYARASFELTESMRKSEMRPMRDLRKGESRAEIFTLQVLERFDNLYKRQLMNEAQQFNEEATSDLNIPYSVSRAIIAEAFPNLVAANVFDVGLMNQSPERIYFEAFTGETGYTVSITDEVETAGAEGTWYALAHPRIVPGTVVVTSNPAGTTYAEGTDYVIDYELGKIKAIAAGAINADDVLVDYDYNAIRDGEDAEIQRAKVSLSYQTIEAAADRLADYITHEAIVFSRSQLGWDATARTMANLVRQTRLNIEKGLIEKALASALSVASNSGGEWTASTDSWSLLVEYLGYAKVKVANRFYEPTGILCSPTNADYLSNWDGFTNNGFPNAVLTAAGYAGAVKGLPVFASTSMRDGWVLVFNREIVMHRIFQPMTIKGPFQTFGSNRKLVAAEQYYTEEYNASLSPIAGKASFVKIS